MKMKSQIKTVSKSQSKMESNPSTVRLAIADELEIRKPKLNYTFCSKQHLAQKQQDIRLSLLTKQTILKANNAPLLIKALTQFAVATICPCYYFHPETLKTYNAMIAKHFTQRKNHKIIFNKLLALIYQINELKNKDGYQTVLKSNEWLSFLDKKNYGKRVTELNKVFAEEGIIAQNDTTVKLLMEAIHAFTLNPSDQNFYSLVGQLKQQNDIKALQAFYTAVIYHRYFY